MGGDRKLVLESVGTADAAALSAVRQIVPAAIQEVARLVYQAPSELVDGLRAETAGEIAQLLAGLGFQVKVAGPDAAVDNGKGEFEVALVVNDFARIAAVIAETAAFLGTDLTTARRLVCRSPAMLLSNVSDATVGALRERFASLGATIDVSRLSTARYYAVIALETKGLRHALLGLIRTIVRDAVVVETDAALTVSDLQLAQAQELWAKLHRIGARVTICNRDLERYDVSLERAVPSPAISATLGELGIPEHVVPRVLRRLPVIIRQNADHEQVKALLDRVVAAGGEAKGLPYSFQRFALALESVTDASMAIQTLTTLGDVAETAAAAAVSGGKGARVGNFTRTTALWLQHSLHSQGARAGIELL